MCILVVELCERLAFYTFTGTQEFFLERHGYSLAQAGGVNAAMGTLCMAWALFAGWMADVVLGRYHTILVFGLLYAIGAFVAATAAWPAFNDTGLYLFGVMVLVPMGTAGIKANISNFGADQFDISDPSQKDAQEKFFSWFYLAQPWLSSCLWLSHDGGFKRGVRCAKTLRLFLCVCHCSWMHAACRVSLHLLHCALQATASIAAISSKCRRKLLSRCGP